MLRILIIIMLVLGAVIYLSYSLIQPELSELAAKVYKVDLLNLPSLGLDSIVKANITWIGSAKVNNLQAGRMATKPPLYNYLKIVSDEGMYYEAVFWSTSSAGEYVAHFQNLQVPVSNENNHVSFYYQGFSGAEVLLGSG